MAIYKIKTGAGTMYASANLVEASAPIHVYFGDNPRYDENGEESDDAGFRWSATPYQTADCRHYEGRLGRLVAEHYDMGDVLDIEALEGLT